MEETFIPLVWPSEVPSLQATAVADAGCRVPLWAGAVSVASGHLWVGRFGRCGSTPRAGCAAYTKA